MIYSKNFIITVLLYILSTLLTCAYASDPDTNELLQSVMASDDYKDTEKLEFMQMIMLHNQNRMQQRKENDSANADLDSEFKNNKFYDLTVSIDNHTTVNYILVLSDYGTIFIDNSELKQITVIDNYSTQVLLKIPADSNDNKDRQTLEIKLLIHHDNVDFYMRLLPIKSKNLNLRRRKSIVSICGAYSARKIMPKEIKLHVNHCGIPEVKRIEYKDKNVHWKLHFTPASKKMLVDIFEREVHKNPSEL